MYRHSAPPVRQQPRYHHIPAPAPPRPASPADSVCSSCEDNSLPLNTPWSSHPTSSASSIVSSRSRRRSSVASEHRPILRNVPAPQPLVVQTKGTPSIRVPSPPRSANAIMMPASSMSSRRERERTRERERERDRGRDRGRDRSVSRRGSDRNSYFGQYEHSVDVADDLDRGHDFPRRGRTKFPSKLVDREAVEELHYPYTEEHDGTIVVLQALGRPEIEELMTRTEELRRRSESGNKSVSFYEKTLVHEVPPSVPSPPRSVSPPPPTIRRSGTPFHHPPSPSPSPTPRSSTPLTAENIAAIDAISPSPASHHLPLPSATTSSYTHVPLSPPTFMPLAPPGPSTPLAGPPPLRSRSRSPSRPTSSHHLATSHLTTTTTTTTRPGSSSSSHRPGSSSSAATAKAVQRRVEIEAPAITLGKKTPEEKIARLEEKALRAEKAATKKEIRADLTRRPADEHEAFKARVKAEELKKRVEDKEWKHRVRAEEKKLKRRDNTYRVGRNRKGEVVIIKGA